MPFVYSGEFELAEYDLEDIDACKNVDLLLSWYEETQNSQDSMKAQVEAALACETYEEEWMLRVRSALGFAGMGVARIKRRLKKLGVNADAVPGEFGSMLALEQGLASQKEATAKAKASAAFGRTILDIMRENLPASTVEDLTAKAANRMAEA